jgi:putative phage-type endonuclease
MFVTASDAPAIMGTSPWRNAADVYLEKTGQVAPCDETEAMYWGHLMEEPIIRFSIRAMKAQFKDDTLRATRNGIRRRHRNGVMSCTLDSKIQGRPWAIEAKTHAACHGNIDLSEWGDPWTDEIPPYYTDQVCAQFACCPEIEVIFVVLSVARRSPSIYMLERAKFANRITEVENACCDFNDLYLVPNIPPAMPPHLDTVKRDRVKRQTEMAVAVPDHLLERSKKIASLMTRLEKKKEEIDSQIRTSMIGASSGVRPKGHVAKISTVTRKSFTVAAGSYSKLSIKLFDPSQPWA